VALRNALFASSSKQVKTLIKEFRYPRLGAGMMYEAAAARIAARGGVITSNAEVIRICHDQNRITAVEYRDAVSKRTTVVDGSDFCSSMPLPYLVLRMDPVAPAHVRRACRDLTFRSLAMVYLIVQSRELFKDNWIYINSNDVGVGRIANYKNWSPDMVPDSSQSSLGLEYFCNESDGVWNKPDAGLIALASDEIEHLNLARRCDVERGFVVRAANAYPVYTHGYQEALAQVRNYVDAFANLACIGRYGMFRYNNMDHSILTGLLAGRNILGAKHDIWNVNVDKEYLEEMERGR
jgi:protoporphyrinogen oxidase